MLFLKFGICENPGVLKVIKFILMLLNIVRFVVPIILIIFLIIDFLKNVIAHSEDEMKKNLNIAIRRLILCVVIFLIPSIVNVSLRLVGSFSKDAYNAYNTCRSNLSNIAEYEQAYREAKEAEEQARLERNANNSANVEDNKRYASGGNRLTESKNSSGKSILMLGNSKTWRCGTDSYERCSVRPSYEFVKMAKLGGYLNSGELNIDSNSDGATSFARNSEVTIGTKGGATLNGLASKYEKYISDREYDIVILQEQMGVSETNASTFESGVKRVLNLLKNKRAKVYIRTSWASNNSSFSDNISVMDSNLTKVINSLKKNSNYSGFTFYAIRDAKVYKEARSAGYDLFSSDDNHQNKKGAYLVAACIYSKVYGNPSNLKYNGFLDESSASGLSSIAYRICK